MLRLGEKFLFAELTERLRMLEGGELGLTQSKEKPMAFSVSHLFCPVTWNTFFRGFFPFLLYGNYLCLFQIISVQK